MSLPVDCHFKDETEADAVRVLACARSKRNGNMLLTGWPGNADVIEAMKFAAERLGVCRAIVRRNRRVRI